MSTCFVVPGLMLFRGGKELGKSWKHYCVCILLDMGRNYLNKISNFEKKSSSDDENGEKGCLNQENHQDMGYTYKQCRIDVTGRVEKY